MTLGGRVPSFAGEQWLMLCCRKCEAFDAVAPVTCHWGNERVLHVLGSMIWFSVVLLAFEASGVIASRVWKLNDPVEAQLLVTEKVGAAFDACAILASGGDALKVIECYRKHVAANADRLKG